MLPCDIATKKHLIPSPTTLQLRKKKITSRRVSYNKQELLTLLEHMCLPPVFDGVCVANFAL